METPQMNLALHRKLEEKLHKTLHNNLCILTLAYSPTSEFANVLKQGMFIKSNPTAFFHTAHFLLNIIDPVSFKNLFEWPLYEKRMETNFRNTFRNHIQQLSDNYTCIKLPPVKVSYMVTPGGYHFTMMMKKLSELAMIMYLKRNGKQVILPNFEESLEKDFLKETDMCDKIALRLKLRFIYRDNFFIEADKEAQMIKNKIELVREKIQLLKTHWKQYIMSISDLTESERKKIIDDPKHTIAVLRNTVLTQLEKNENLSMLLANKVELYKNIDTMSNILLERAKKKYSLEYDQNLKDLSSSRKYVSENFITYVEKVAKNGVLNFPLLLNSVTSILTEMSPLIPQRKINEDTMISIKINSKNLKNILNEFNRLNKGVHDLEVELQSSLNKVRIDFEKIPEREDSPITSVTSFWPASSPYRELKLHNDNFTAESTSLNSSANRSTSMFDISKLSNSLRSKSVVQPAWLNSNMMSVKKAKQKPLNKKSQRYQSTPCLASPPSTIFHHKQESLLSNLGLKICSPEITPICNTNEKISTLKKEHNASNNLEKYFTPIKQSRRSIGPKLKNIEKRLSYVADEMPKPTLNTSFFESPCGSLNIHSTLGNKLQDSQESLKRIIDEEMINECLNSPLFENKYVESLIHSSKTSCLEKIRLSMGTNENLNNISIPNDFNHSLDSD